MTQFKWHEADSKNVHGIADTADLILSGGAAGGMLTGNYPNPTLSMSPITNSLSADVALNNTALYFDGPSVAQGSVGTWFVSGTVSLTQASPVNNSQFEVKLWDGTTVIASALAIPAGTGAAGTSLWISVSLSGYIAAPAGNLRISVRDIVNTTGAIKYNGTGTGKDSTITALRIA